MKFIRSILFSALCIVSIQAFAADQPVMQVNIVNQSGASIPFSAMSDRYAEIYKKYKSKAERTVWFNAMAGSSTGQVIIMYRYPSMAAWTADMRVVQSPEYQALATEFAQKGFKLDYSSLAVGQ